MANSKTEAIIFDCDNCKKESRYPNEMEEGADTAGAKILIKKCTTCGADNKIELPAGWIAKRTDSVFRGSD